MSAASDLTSGAALVHHTATASTNADAFAYEAMGARLPAWIIADTQTAGRGRSGRSWQSIEGNLLASYVFHTACDVAHATQLAFVAGLAVADTVAGALPNDAAPPQLKWPNDVLMNGAKLAGILVQTGPSSRPKNQGHAPKLTAVIGIGLNVAAAPDGLDQPTTCLAAHRPKTCPPLNPRILLDTLDRNLAGWLLRWRDAAGWPDIRAVWMERNGLIGRRVKLDGVRNLQHGVLSGIDETGALLISLDDGTRSRVTVGDVTLT